jgi:hypothetical protein
MESRIEEVQTYKDFEIHREIHRVREMTWETWKAAVLLVWVLLVPLLPAMGGRWGD